MTPKGHRPVKPPILTGRRRLAVLAVLLSMPLSACANFRPQNLSSIQTPGDSDLLVSIGGGLGELGEAIGLPQRPPVVAAQLDVNCDGTVYTVSTGTSGGKCEWKAEGTTVECNDGQNKSSLSCGAQGTHDGCVSSEGAGSCTIKFKP